MSDRSRKICFALLHHDPACADPERFFARAPLMRHLPQAVARRGYQVDVVMRFATPHEFVEGGVRYHLVPSPAGVAALARHAGRLLKRGPTSFDPACRAVRTIRALEPDLIHLHGATLYLNHALLLAALGRRRPPIVLHYHGGYPSPNAPARRVQRRLFRRVDRFLFTTRDHARPFIDAGLIEDPGRVEAFMETSSPFRPHPRSEARRATGMGGDPVFLWAGRLDANKDPMTALRGFEQILETWPNARLYLHYLADDLLPALRQYAGARPSLKARMHFGGRVPFERMEAVYNSADFLLQASHREFSGAAVLDALACGVLPVVTDIPSFRAMTDGGRYGVLFPPGGVDALVRGVLAIAPGEIPERSRQARAWFERALSFPALARHLDAVYRGVCAAPSGRQKTEPGTA